MLNIADVFMNYNRASLRSLVAHGCELDLEWMDQDHDTRLSMILLFIAFELMTPMMSATSTQVYSRESIGNYPRWSRLWLSYWTYHRGTKHCSLSAAAAAASLWGHGCFCTWTNWTPVWRDSLALWTTTQANGTASSRWRVQVSHADRSVGHLDLTRLLSIFNALHQRPSARDRSATFWSSIGAPTRFRVCLLAPDPAWAQVSIDHHKIVRRSWRPPSWCSWHSWLLLRCLPRTFKVFLLTKAPGHTSPQRPSKSPDPIRQDLRLIPRSTPLATRNTYPCRGCPTRPMPCHWNQVQAAGGSPFRRLPEVRLKSDSVASTTSSPISSFRRHFASIWGSDDMWGGLAEKGRPRIRGLHQEATKSPSLLPKQDNILSPILSCAEPHISKYIVFITMFPWKIPIF